MPSLLNIDKFCEELKEVKSLKIFEKNNFHPEGLYSEQIFGPLKNFTCQCGTHYSFLNDGETCSVCGVDITNSKVRRKRFAKIVLPFRVMNPIFYDFLVSIGGKKLQSLIDDLLKKDKSILYKDCEFYSITYNPDTVPIGATTYEKTEAIEELVKDLSKKFADEGYSDWKLIYDNLDCMFIENIVVLPADLRPTSKNTKKVKGQISDEINRYYVQLLIKKELHSKMMVDITRDKSLFHQIFVPIQNDVNELYENILIKMSKKKGLIRNNILGKRIDFSGRAVAIPDPTLNFDEAIIPYFMFLELFKLKAAKKLVEIGKFLILNNAIDYIDECIVTNNPCLLHICQHLAEREYALINRQPSLHRMSMLGFKLKVSMDNVIKMHPLTCASYNLDFDGDQVAIYIPITKASEDEIKVKLLASKHLTSPANATMMAKPGQDIVLGIYVLTNNLLPKEFNEIVKYKGKEITRSRKIFNDCLPEDYPLVDEVIDSKKLLTLLQDINEKYDNRTTCQVLDHIKNTGFVYCTAYAPTLSLESMYVSNAKKMRDEVLDNKDSNRSEKIMDLAGKEIEDELKKNFKYSYMIESGSRGSWDQAKQLVLSRGFVSNFKGEIVSTPIRRNLLEGLEPYEFFLSTYGSRKGLLDTALNTGAGGYLSRKLVFCCANLQLDPDHDDCGTTDYFEVDVNTKRKAEMLNMRYYLNDNDQLEKITRENCYSLIGKKIKLRSPIYCQSEHICKKCYGDLYRIVNGKYVGLIAATSLGETNVQLILRQFHVSGVATVDDKKGKVSDEDLRQKDIVSDLSSASKLLHNLDKVPLQDAWSKLFEIYNNSKPIHSVHFECILAQLMWTGAYKWRLLKNRNEVTPKLYSIQSVPSYESWLLGMAFSRPKQNILRGLLTSGQYEGIFDSIILGKKIT